MAKRTFLCKGIGIGTGTTSITVTMDGTQIFSGPVATIDKESAPDKTELQTMFSWELDVDDRAWVRPVTIVVTGGDFYVCEFSANYGSVNDETASIEVQKDQIASVATVYKLIYREKINDHVHSDPKSNITIDGQPQTKIETDTVPPLAGEWWWAVPEGSTIAFDLTCNAFDAIPAELFA